MENKVPTEPVKFAGVAVFMNGKNWIVPSLSVRQFKDNVKFLTKDFGEVSAENFGEKVDELIPVILLALKRNYPDITADDLLDMLDLSTLPLVVQAVAAASGMKKVAPGEPQPVLVN